MRQAAPMADNALPYPPDNGVHTLYGMSGSGNCYKPALAMRQLGIKYRWREIDVVGGETRGEAFRALNPNGKVPVLVLPSGEVLTESNAMLCYLAEGTPLLPADRLARARVLEWLFFEQYSHEPYIATVRFWVHIQRSAEANAARIAEAIPRGEHALAVMERRLAAAPFLAGDAYTVADIALYAYTHVAHQGGYELGAFPAVTAWLDRVPRQPGHATMAEAAAGG